MDYINGFPPFLQDVFNTRFDLPSKLKKMADKDKLYTVFEKICGMDLHPDKISNLEMGYLYEDLIRKFSEAANEDAGDHYTPREVVTLIAKLIFIPVGVIYVCRTMSHPICPRIFIIKSFF